MFRTPFNSSFSCARLRLRSPVSIVFLALLLVPLLSGCGGTKKSNTQDVSGTTAANNTAYDDDRYVVNPNKQIRWHYQSLPDPAPSSKPNYLLKSYTCASASAALNTEARGSVADLIETLQAKPTIRVLCLGLCDGHNEKANAANLGMNRAHGARQFLISRGIAKNRIEAATFGSSQSKAPAGESIGQGLDRKVEIWLLTE